MKKASIVLLFLLTGLAVNCPAFESKDQGAWWIDNYGVLTSEEHPLAARAQNVFERVLAAADKRSSRMPYLVIIRQAADPWAICLRDGAIILTQKGLEICYRGEEKQRGDARLAFILGHELAHLAKDDFWHLAAFNAVRQFGSGKEAVRQIRDLLLKTEDIADTAHAKEIIRKKELQADAYGMLYASMAGFDTGVIVNGQGENFFTKWTAQTTGAVAYTDKEHPTPEMRGAFLLSQMKAVANELYLFDLGLRHYQLGRYGDALVYFQAFREQYPCREVYNNLGLVRYQMAVRALAREDSERAMRFKLAAAPDFETRADKIMASRGSLTSVFKRHIKDAIRDFETACAKDTHYLPARVNLSSALIMAENFSGALAILDEAAEIKADDPDVIGNRALAMYLLGPSIKVDMFSQAVANLKKIVHDYPDLAAPLYNLGRLMAERGRNANAQRFRKEFIKREPVGKYADLVRKQLGLAPAKAMKDRNSPFSIPAPVKLGDFDAQTEAQLAGFTEHPLELGVISGAFYIGDGARALVLDYVVEMVEMPLQSRLKAAQIRSQYGSPLRIVNAVGDRQTLVYDHFAIDIRNGAAQRVVYFQ